MKAILADYFERALPWWLFLGSVAFLMEACLGAGFLWAGAFALPLGLDFARGSIRAQATLPVKRQSLALACWFFAVAVPVAMTTSMAAVVCLFHPAGYSFHHLVLTVTGSLGLAGALFLFLTCLAGASASESPAFAIAAALVPVMCSGVLSMDFLELSISLHPLLILVSLLLALLGLLRAEQLLLPRSSRRAPRKLLAFGSRWRSSSRPGTMPFQAAFFRLLTQSLYTAATLAVISKIFGKSDTNFIFLGFMTIVPVQLLLPLRHMRLLPFSTRHLALLYIAAPFLGVFASGFFVSLLQASGLGRLLPAHPFGPLLCVAGADLCGVGLELRLGLSGQMLGMFLVMTVGALVGNGVSLAVSLPCFSVALLVAYVANTHTLRCSATYRVNRDTLVA